MEANKKVLTDAQKAARLKNIQKASKVRMQNINERKKVKEQEEYDLSSNEENESSSESDNDAFIISKKKPTKKTKVVEKTIKPRVLDRTFDDKSYKLKNELDELRNIVTDMALMQKKQHKATRKQTNRTSGGTKIVVLPQSQGSNQSGPSDTVMDALRRSLM